MPSFAANIEKTLHAALTDAGERHHEYATLEHLLLALIDDDDAAQECFRKYDEALSSFEDHSKFLTGRARYSDLFKLKPDDYKGWAKGLRRAGYATDRQYPEKLIGLIERYRLYEYDRKVLGISSKQEAITDSSEPENTIKDQSVIHRVQAGDTLYSLSKKYNTTVERIQYLNGLTSTTLSVGQELKIK